MSASPVICFGQQPCGFFPKRFLVAKIQTARRLQAELGGEIVFFYHDSDHDPRETKTLLRHRKTGEPAQLNFTFENRLQRKFSPLYLKRIPPDWHDRTMLQLPNYMERQPITLFEETSAGNTADFCLEMYRRLGLLDGLRVVRSSDPAFRRIACDVDEFFVDIPHEGEIVRARCCDGAFEASRRRRSFCETAADDFHQGTSQSVTRYPSPLDAIRCSLHSLRLRRQRTGLPAHRRNTGDYLRET